MLGLLAVLLPNLLPPLINLAERAIAGSKQGPAKKDFVLSTAGQSLDILVNAGKVDAEDAAIVAKVLDSLIDAKVSEMNANGELSGKTITYETPKSVTLTF